MAEAINNDTKAPSGNQVAAPDSGNLTPTKESAATAAAPALTYPEGVTQDQVDAWKKKYGDGNVKMIEVPIADSEEIARCIIYNPRLHKDVRTMYAKGIKLYRNDDPIGQGELILNNCLLAGDERIKGTDEFVRICAAMEAKEQFLFLSARTVDI
jgi:hypothetical protein